MLPLAVALTAALAATPPPKLDALRLGFSPPGACTEIDPNFVHYVSPGRHAGGLLWLVANADDKAGKTLVFNLAPARSCLHALIKTKAPVELFKAGDSR